MRTRRLLRLAAPLILVAAATHAAAGPAAAECTFIPPFPAAEPAIRSADEVFVGRIVQASAADLRLDPSQGPREIALRVTIVLRGPRAVGDLVDVENLEPNWPWIKYQGGTGEAVPSCTRLAFEVQIGDTIALALGAVQPTQRLEVDGVSWTQPRTSYNGMTKVRSEARLAEIRRIAGLPQTDMASQDRRDAAPAWPWVLALGLGVLGGAASWRRASRLDPADR
jgi:hypothetical protein